MFQDVAADHGAPNWYCPHGNLQFLPWHRRFIRRFEEALGIKLPYWDWTKPEEPTIVTAATYVDSNGVTQPNPLYSGLVPTEGNRETSRSNGNPWSFDTERLESMVEFALSRTTFADHSSGVESPHNFVHVWIGSDMGRVGTAAYDPIFWLHHNYCDYLWYLWQLDNPDAFYPAEATGDMEDSEGVFEGQEEIDDLSGWTTTISGDSLSTLRRRSPITTAHLIFTIVKLHSARVSLRVDIVCSGVLMGSVYSFAMDGPGPGFVADRALDVTKNYHRHLKDVDVPTMMNVCVLVSREAVSHAPYNLSKDTRLHVEWTHF